MSAMENTPVSESKTTDNTPPNGYVVTDITELQVTD